jgi:hypothetical protein
MGLWSVRMASRTSIISLIAANILIPIAILIFARGFFPYKPFLAGLAEYETLEYGPPPEAPFDKVVFMVVDALRRCGILLDGWGTANSGSDFVYSGSSGFQFTQRYHFISDKDVMQWSIDRLQSHCKWSSNSIYSSCHFSYDHNAEDQGYDHRLYTIVSRPDIELRGIGHLLLARFARHMDCTDESQTDRKYGYVRR